MKLKTCGPRMKNNTSGGSVTLKKYEIQGFAD